MRTKLLFFGLLLAMATQTLAQVPRSKPCQNYTAPPEYNSTAFAGRWYEFARVPRLLEPFTKCVYFEYSTVYDGQFIIATIQRAAITGLRTRTQISVTPSQPGAWNSITGFQYRIIATDNTRFAVIQACNDGLFGSSELLWILTREMHPDYATAFAAELDIYIGMERYSLKGLQTTDQDNCPKEDDDLFG